MGDFAWKLLPYLRPYRPRVAWALLQVFLIAGFDLLKPWPLQLVIDHVLGGKPLTARWLAGSTARAGRAAGRRLRRHSSPSVSAAGLLTLLHNYTTIGVGQRMVNDLRGALYAHLQRLSLAFHSRQKVGDLMYRITADSFAVQTMIMNGLLPIVSALVLLGRHAVRADPARSAADAAVADHRAGALRADRDLQPQDHRRSPPRCATRESHVYTLVQWAMSSIKVVQAFTKEEEEYRRFMGASRASLDATLTLYSWQTLYSGVVNTRDRRRHRARRLCRRALGAERPRSRIGQLVVFISYLAQLYVPVNQITQSWGLIAGARIGAAPLSSRSSTPRPI